MNKTRFVLILLILTFLLPLSSCKKKKTGEGDFSFAFLTDIHVQPEKRAAEGFRMAIDRVNSLAPDFVLTGGDLIMDALRQKQSRADSLYALYDSLSAFFSMPVHNAMGNHENFGFNPLSGVDPENPMYGKKMFEKYIGKRYYAFDHKGWRFYILDSVEKDTTGEGVYYGHVDSLQISWLKHDLSQVSPETPLVLVVHIPLVTIMTQLLSGSTAPNSKGIVITNSKEVLGAFQGHDLKLVLQGHLHFLEDLYAEGTHFLTGGAVCASWWNGPRDGLEEGFVMVHTHGNDFSWEYIDYGWEAAQQE